ncbi:putative nucleic acid-binding protein [Aurantimonas endophytica]|uniref:Putative nucleic acid-binding protein n=1 Tax=Aurantimonas endophytica TaxID=1522175 RepID=A0A7W6H9S2_9HYPH|nr:putative nucleic acid-binding protein [Aurantimonas endophytica]
MFELQLGIELAKRRGNNNATAFEQRLDGILADGRYQIMLPTVDAARVRATLSALPALRNLVIPNPCSNRIVSCEKLTIAATAISAGAAIATLNRRHYAEIARCFPLPGVFYPDTGDWDNRCGRRSAE